MERTKSPPSDLNTSPPPPPLKPDQNQDFAANFTSMYHSIFPPKSPQQQQQQQLSSLTPSTCPSSSSSTSSDLHVTSTEHRLNQARFILEYHQLCDHYDLCLSRLNNLTKELQLLHQENADLRFANTELLKLFNQLTSHSTILSPRSVMIEPNRFERRNADRNTLPKSISVRSSGGGPSRSLSRQRVNNKPVQQRVYVPGGGKREEEEEEGEKEGMEFEVYDQGMWKTEICNKWQETGTCPYGDQCQFAHGITELRPVIRHPRYKTQVCRMVVAGDTCPYGHRCHFRHSLTEQERLLMGPR